MKKKSIVMLMVVALISGCAGMSDSQRTKTEGTAAGSGIGAAVGAGLGQIFGGDTKSTLIGAGIGAAIGGGLGYAYGNHVANKKNNYSTTEDYLNACIASAREVKTETQAYNASLRSQIRILDQQINNLAAKYNTNKAYRTQLINKQKEVQREYADAESRLERVRKEVAIQKEVIDRERGTSSTEIRDLDREIAELEKAARDLEGQTQKLASINQKAVI